MMRRLAAAVLLTLAGAAFGQGVSLPDARTVELDNGAVFVVYAKADVPLVGLTATIRGGAVSDPDGKTGLASLVAGLLEKGAGDRDAAAFAEAVDSVGGSLSASAERETLTVSAEFLARDADLMLELVTDMLDSPALAPAEVEKLRDRRIDLLRAAKDNDPRPLTPIYGAAFLFGDHPYGRPVDGDEASLASISAGDVRGYYEDYFGANRLVISVVGAIDADAMVDRLRAAFGDWKRADGTLPEIPPPVPGTGRRVLLVDKPGATQTYFWIGNVGVARNYARRAELDIANTLFGGRFTSLLMNELRTRAGLTYGASSSLVRPSLPGSVAIVSYTKTESTVEAIDLALELLGRLHGDGFDSAAIASGKNYILGQFPPRLETASQLADQFAALETFGLDPSYVNGYADAVANAAGEDVATVIDDVYPDPANLVFVVLGDAAAIRGPIARYGPVTEMPMAAPHFAPN